MNAVISVAGAVWIAACGGGATDPATPPASSSHAAVTTVDASGLVTAVDSGMATITASAGEAAGEAVVRVVPPGAPLDLLLDSLMVAFTAEHGIGAAAMDVVKDGVIVYDRVFGGGGLPGMSTIARQCRDGVNYVVLFNKGPQPHCGRLIRDLLDDILGNTRIAWPRGRRAPDTANRVLDAAIGESR